MSRECAGQGENVCGGEEQGQRACRESKGVVFVCRGGVGRESAEHAMARAYVGGCRGGLGEVGGVSVQGRQQGES